MSIKQVLVVDDRPTIRSLVEATVGSCGYQVMIAGDAKTAWRTLQSSPVDLVIIGSTAPRSSGLELCRRIRDELPEPYRYILMLAAQQEHDALLEGLEAGADDLLCMPLSTTGLRLRLRIAERRLVKRHRHDPQSKDLVATNARGLDANEESEAVRPLAYEAGRLGTWWCNTRDRICGGDPLFLALYGLPPAGASYPIEVFIERIASQSAAPPKVTMPTSLSPGQELEEEVEITSGPTAGKWIRWRGRADLQDPALIRGISFDVTDHKRTEAALRESQERLQLATEAAGLGIFDIDLVTLEMEWDARQREIWGVGAKEVITDDIFVAGIHSADRGIVQEAIARAYDPDGEGLYAAEYRVCPLDKSGERWIAATGRVHFWERHPVRLIGTVQDITARKSAEAALRDSEERFRQFGEASSDVLWIRAADAPTLEYLSPAFETIYGMSREDVLTGKLESPWPDVILPEDRQLVADNMQRVAAGERVDYTFRIRRPSDGENRRVRRTAFPLLDTFGRVQRIAGISRDVTEEVELHERMEVLVAELQHRTRNLLGVVRSLADKSITGSASLRDFRARFRDRLDALARVNGLLSRLQETNRVTFDELLEAELLAHGVRQSGRRNTQVSFHGPKGIRLRSSTVQIFALALHELATNAVKYGGLSHPDGRVEVNWHLAPGPDQSPRLHVDWRESGIEVPEYMLVHSADETQPRRGFGRDLVERILPHQLGADTTYQFNCDGVHCTITLPVSLSPHDGSEGADSPELATLASSAT